MAQCKTPVDVLKRIMSTSLGEINQNIQLCMASAQKYSETQNKMVQDEDKIIACLAANKEIMRIADSKIQFGLEKF